MIVECMCKLALGGIVSDETAEKLTGLGGVAGGVAWALHKHFADHSQRLPNALKRANQRAWKTLELALAGDSWLSRLKKWMARGEDKAMAAQIQAFLEANCLKELDQQPADVRQLCLEDLQKARAKELEEGPVNGDTVAEEAKSWQSLQDPQDRVKNDLQTVSRMAAHLRRKGYAHLAWMLDLQVHKGESLLVTAVRYYFRREVESNRELFQGLVFAQGEQLEQAQAKGFAELNLVLANQWDLLDELLKRAGETLEEVIKARNAALGAQAAAEKGAEAAQGAQDAAKKGVDAALAARDVARQGADAALRAATAARAGQDAAKAGHEAVLDLKEELQKQVAALGQQTREQFEQFYKPIIQMLEKLQLQSRPVRASDSMSIRTDQDRREAEQLVKHYSALPAEQRRHCPALLNGLGQLEFAVNDFENAQKMFTEVANIVQNDSGKALAHYNAYRAALERQPRRFDEALKELLKAVELDAENYAPFPVKDYEPVKILGAGGFGVTFQCRNTFTQGQVAIKSLTTDGLERDVQTVFSEAQALDEMQHPSVIRLRHCGYADMARRRPFIVMDYFPGQTLEEFVEQYGKIKWQDFLGLARPVAEALAAAHAYNILHRDIKPANLLVLRKDGTWKVRVIDFGLAMRQSVLTSVSTSRALHDRTLAGSSIAGTIDYAAPEQMGKLPGVAVGPASDVYGFAKTCCFALLGNTEPTLEDWETLPKPLAQLLSKCMARTPEKRFPSFQEVIKGLDGVTAKPSPPPPPQQQQQRPVESIPVTSLPPVLPVTPLPKMPEVFQKAVEKLELTGKPVPPPAPPSRPPEAIPAVAIPSVLPVEPRARKSGLHPPPPPKSNPPPLVMQATLVPEAVPVLSGAIPVALPVDKPKPKGEPLLVRLFGNGGKPNLFDQLSKKPRKIKVYLDGDFIGEGDEWKGFDLRTHTKPGQHTVTLKALENVSPNIWAPVLQEVTKTFSVEFAEGGKYTVRFDYLERSKLDLVTVDVLRGRG